MNCAIFERKLDLLLGEGLTVEEERAAREHVLTCIRCRELLEIARGDLDILPAGEQEELTEGILVRTSGPACGRVEEALCDLVGGNLREDEEELVSSHLDHCARCAALAGVLPSLQSDLSTMAEIEPDERFVADVMAATAYRHGPMDRLASNAVAWWNRQLHRPRFTMEIAYSGAVLLFLLFGAPGSPLHGVSPRAAAVARTNPVDAVTTLWEGNREVPAGVSMLGWEVWRRTGAPVTARSRDLWNRGRERGETILEIWAIGRGSIGEAGHALWRGDFYGVWRTFDEGWKAIRDRWRGSPPPP